MNHSLGSAEEEEKRQRRRMFKGEMLLRVFFVGFFFFFRWPVGEAGGGSPPGEPGPYPAERWAAGSPPPYTSTTPTPPLHPSAPRGRPPDVSNEAPGSSEKRCREVKIFQSDLNCQNSTVKKKK